MEVIVKTYGLGTDVRVINRGIKLHLGRREGIHYEACPGERFEAE